MAAAPPPENSSFSKEEDEHWPVFLRKREGRVRERKKSGGRERVEKEK
jgi:hypothetical protein